ncbi:MAG: hypothetical protein ABIQ95_04075 [Bdellovibrionia bacterium]
MPSILKRSHVNPRFSMILLVCTLLISTSGYSAAPLPGKTPSKPSPGRVSTLSGDWEIPYDGEGFISFDSENGIVMQPAVSSTPYETHAALALSALTKAHPMKDFQVMIRASTEEQLRTPTPNSWEVFSIYFNYNADNEIQKNTNYLKLTDNGLELGTLSDKIGQTFLATSKSRTLTIGKIYTYMLTKKGNHIDISIDGDSVASFTGSNSPNNLYDAPGAIGLFTEDARVHIYSVEILPL